MANIQVLHGPNLNLLGTREPEIYGDTTLAKLNQTLMEQGATLGHSVFCAQHNGEAPLIENIHNCHSDFLLFNPGAYTHTSIALRDALLAKAIPFIEIHISNVYAREDFRQQSYLRDIAIGSLCGLGVCGYSLALQAAHQYLTKGLKSLWICEK